jgi:hypothetical protein
MGYGLWVTFVKIVIWVMGMGYKKQARISIWVMGYG